MAQQGLQMSNNVLTMTSKAEVFGEDGLSIQ